MSAATTFDFSLTHEVGTSEFLPGLAVEEVKGQLVIPTEDKGLLHSPSTITFRCTEFRRLLEVRRSIC